MNLESGVFVPKEKKKEADWYSLVAIYAGILRDENFSGLLPDLGLSQEEAQNFKPTDLVGLNSREHNGMTFMQNHTGHTIANAGRQILQKISNSRASENYRPSYNLNLSSRSEAWESSSAARLFKLDPITPDQHKQLKINQINQVPHFLLNTISTQERDRQDNDDLPNQPETVARERTSSAGFSTAPKEKQNSDGGQGGIDLNETPPQKTPKRKKHQPKVVVAGIPKRTPESAANKNNSPDGNPPPKRKYARKTNTQNSTNQSTEIANGVEASGVDSKAKSCKRALDFDVDNGAEKKSKGIEFDSANKVQHQESWPLAATRSGEDKKEIHSVDDTIGHKKDLHIDTNGVGFVGEESSAVVPYKKIAPTKKSRPQSKVNLDPETRRLWNLLMSKEGSQSAEAMDKDKQEYWDKEREVFRGRVDSFIAQMHLVQGNRRFSKWKGSVVDSVIGVFLTQNVSDHLSSSAFMSLAAKFPIKSEPVIEACCLNRGRTSLEHGLTVSYSDETASDHRMKRKTVYGQSSMESSRQNQASEDIGSSLGSNSEAEHQISRSNFRKHHDPSKFFQQVEVNAPFEQYQFQEMGSSLPDNRKRKAEKEKAEFNWDSLRRQAQSKPEPRGRSRDIMDSIDYEALLDADVGEVSEAIKARGMNKMLAERIKDFLNRLVRDHELIDLEWLRDVQQDKARDYLSSIQGLGPKSVDCVRLLTLHHLAFPVDTNVGRIAVRLGWVPLQPLPGSIQFHLVDEYPVLATVQKYLWPRLCKLDQETLYELHYQMITFGKVFCTKKEPNCNACPMRRECRHFTSASASSRLALPGPGERHQNSSAAASTSSNRSAMDIRPMPLPIPQNNLGRGGVFSLNCEPIIEEPTTPESPVEVPERDIEDAFYEDPDEITAITLNIEEFTTNFLSNIQEETEMQEGDMSKALVMLSPEIASIPRPKLKHASRLRTEHQVYELPDSHPLLKGLDKREADDPSPYLFALWTPGETADSVPPPESKCSSSGDGLCDKKTFVSCNSRREAHAQTVRGTILIPCRTAMRGSFPLNGTYFQVNEVFADHETSLNPVHVPRGLIWNLPRRTVFCGTSVSTIFKGLSAERIQFCFWRGFVCVRGFEPKSRAPRPLHKRFHLPASKVAKENE